jgi:hypothetical protein
VKRPFLQKGQAYAELLVSFIIIISILLGAALIWRFIEAKQLLQSSARFILWERTVWEPSNNDVEKHSLHRSEESLARSTLVHQLSLPSAWRDEKAGLEADTERRREMLKPGIRALIRESTDPLNILSISTTSERQLGEWVGHDPTMNTTTSLELDRDVYRTISVSLKHHLPVFWKTCGLFMDCGRKYYEVPIVFTPNQSMSIIANTWAASAPLNELRSDRQLGVMSTGQSVSGTKPNKLVTFGQNGDPSSVGIGDFVGLGPWWNFVGGVNGIGGQFAIHKIGLNAPQALAFMNSGQYPWDKNKSVIENSIIKSQEEQAEHYTPNQGATPNVRKTIVVDKTSDVKDDIPRNSVFKCCRKYMAFPIGPDQYFGSSP